MINGNLEKFNTPIRNIAAAVELSCDSSIAATVEGNPITINDATPHTDISIQLQSDTITDFSKIGVTTGAGSTRRYKEYRK